MYRKLQKQGIDEKTIMNFYQYGFKRRYESAEGTDVNSIVNPPITLEPEVGDNPFIEITKMYLKEFYRIKKLNKSDTQYIARLRRLEALRSEKNFMDKSFLI